MCKIFFIFLFFLIFQSRYNERNMLVISGASASGKTKIAHIIAKKHGLSRVITVTTRNKRVGEVDGVDYFFVTKDEFKQLIEEDKLVEYTLYNNNYYGSRKDQIANDRILVIEANGLKSYIALNDPSIVTFALIADAHIRKERMIARGDNIKDIEARLNNDKKVFSKENLKGVDYFINNGECDIECIAEDIYNKYLEKINNK